jgi:hypothetical protein
VMPVSVLECLFYVLETVVLNFSGVEVGCGSVERAFDSLRSLPFSGICLFFQVSYHSTSMALCSLPRI